jgi:hypothetical protein
MNSLENCKNVKVCCKDDANLETQPNKNPEMHIRKCKVCGANHYRLVAELGKFGIIGNDIG